MNVENKDNRKIAVSLSPSLSSLPDSSYCVGTDITARSEFVLSAQSTGRVGHRLFACLYVLLPFASFPCTSHTSLSSTLHLTSTLLPTLLALYLRDFLLPLLPRLLSLLLFSLLLLPLLLMILLLLLPPPAAAPAAPAAPAPAPALDPPPPTLLDMIRFAALQP
eukprot:756777-Hanusia_phi.AAC.2